MLVLRHRLHELQPDQHDVDFVLLQPANGVGDGRLEPVERYIGERIVGADLPKQQVRLRERDLGLDPDGRVGGKLARNAAVDDDDVEALVGLLQQLLDLMDIAARAAADGRRADRQNAQRLAIPQRSRDVRQRVIGGDRQVADLAGLGQRRRRGRLLRPHGCGAGRRAA